MREDDSDTGSATEPATEPGAGGLDSYGDGSDGQDYVDRSKIDFDPADGLLSGTAIDGTSDIPDAGSPTDPTSGDDAPS